MQIDTLWDWAERHGTLDVLTNFLADNDEVDR